MDEKMREEIRRIAYRAYLFDDFKRRVSINKINRVAKEWAYLENHKTSDFVSYALLRAEVIDGFKFVSFNTFLEYEYGNLDYMHELLSEDEYEYYLKDIGK